MPNLHELENAMPVAPLKIIALPSAEKMGRRINDYMVEFRKSIHNDKVKNDPAFHGYIESNYLVDVDVPRFGSGEAKAQISETIRGKDLFILTDVCIRASFVKPHLLGVPFAQNITINLYHYASDTSRNFLYNG